MAAVDREEGLGWTITRKDRRAAVSKRVVFLKDFFFPANVSQDRVETDTSTAVALIEGLGAS